jgi:ABC-type bacteriocin/lantibiotic exporter with double-glycine peptidase domain
MRMLARLRHVPGQRVRVPEVIQTSAMDCGPASLKALLEGFGIGVRYGRLREACQTTLDGTSIDTLEHVAGKLCASGCSR